MLVQIQRVFLLDLVILTEGTVSTIIVVSSNEFVGPSPKTRIFLFFYYHYALINCCQNNNIFTLFTSHQ